MKIFSNLALILCAFCLSFTAQAQSGGNSRDSSIQKKNQRAAQTTNSNANPTQSDKQNSNQNENQTNDSSAIAADDEILRVETNLVTVPVSVSDREGRFVSGLNKEDFQVFENGKQQQIEYFAPTEQPFTVALLLDVSLSASLKIDEIQGAAYLFVQQLRPADRVLIVSFDQETRFLNEPTNDREVLRQAINKTKFGQGTSLYETVRLTFERVRKIKGRKAIVLFTDGVDTTSRLTNDSDNLRESQELDALIYPIRYDTFKDVQAIKDAPASSPPILNPNPIPGSPVPFPTSDPRKPPTFPGTNIPLPLPQRRAQTQIPYPTGDPTMNPLPTENDREVVAMGRGDTPQEYKRGKEYLDKLAANTGGRGYEADSKGNLARAFDRIAEELRRQYSLGYYPETEGKQGERRKIKVKVNREKTVVRARDEYIIGSKESRQ